MKGYNKNYNKFVPRDFNISLKSILGLNIEMYLEIYFYNESFQKTIFNYCFSEQKTMKISINYQIM